jgi:hypothetical protein
MPAAISKKKGDTPEFPPPLRRPNPAGVSPFFAALQTRSFNGAHA